MYKHITQLSKTFSPAAVGTSENKALFRVKKGDRVIWCQLEILVRSQTGVATSTYSVGDGDAGVDGLLAVSNTDQAVNTLVNGTGTALGTSSGKLYLADDNVDMNYIFNTAGTTNPKCRVTIGVARHTPK